MPGIARAEVSSCGNPVLWFLYQVNGNLTNLNSLRFSVNDLTGAAPVEVVANTVVTVGTACTAGGHRLGTGRYVAAFTAGAAWNIGTHEIVWNYRAAAADPETTVRRRFEVLDATRFAHGLQFTSYLDSATAIARGVGTAATIRDLQDQLDEASRALEAITDRYFEPRATTLRLDGRGKERINTGHSIIGIGDVVIEQASVGGALISNPIDATLYRVYNRHLTQGLLDPDDRDDPKVQFIPAAEHLLTPTDNLTWPLGRQNILVPGVFGYTEPDGTPSGRTPLMASRAVLLIAARRLTDPLGEDAQPGLIRSARTRDQSVTFHGGDAGGAPSGFFGDPAIDSIVLRLCRPARMGATLSALHDT